MYVTEAFKKTHTTFKALDIVINNAGILDDSRWELEIAINVVSTALKHVTLFVGVTNTHSGGFYTSGMWRCVACYVTHADVSKEPSAFIFNACYAVTIYQLVRKYKTEDTNRYEHRIQKLRSRLVVCSWF
jgi:NAD(P)-dependent dehydrogenase (short-subunit alcohol dehydrogenase family)